MADATELIIGVDAGTSVIKAVAFDLVGRQIASASVRNSYASGEDGSATQSLDQTWADCVSALRGLGDRVEGLARRTVAMALTAQGDGTWLVGKDDRPVTDAWLWLDARAAPTVTRLAAGAGARGRFEATGTGLTTCQQSAQLAHIDRHQPELLDGAEVAMHCKDWLYLNLTGVRATDPSEAIWTFGDFRTRRYEDGVIEAVGLGHRRGLLPEIVDGSEVTHPLTEAAAEATGLRAGMPVALGYVDLAMTGMGAGLYTGRGDQGAACSIIGSTGVHMRSMPVGEVALNDAGTGFLVLVPVPGMVAQAQSNMAATLNIDWALGLAADLAAEFGPAPSHAELVAKIDGWMAASQPGGLVYHPYISDAGERGPFVDADARASLLGLSVHSRFPDVIRAVVEGLGMAARDCYDIMGALPTELRLTGGAARSASLRGVLAAALGSQVRVSAREEAGAAGAAMMAAVAIGAYDSMDACVADWVTPLLGPFEAPDPELTRRYGGLFPVYRAARQAMAPLWDGLREIREAQHG